ncbi:MAG: pbpF 3 [Firmicutes bacterium]|nr:pbpF 3 [Bacillota bacterium]
MEKKNINTKIWSNWCKKIFRVIFATSFLMMFVDVGYAFWGLPATDNLTSFAMKAATEVYDINGQLISKLFEENRVVISITKMSPYIQQAVVANEDVRFYSHFGVDPIGILRAIWIDITTASFAEGGSTITQQLARGLFLTQEQTVGRKLKEAVLAIIIERKFSKQEILQAYLNQVYFGEGAYGVEAAAQTYFGKHAAELSLAESALMAGLPRGPNIYSPYADIEAALRRRGEVLQGMANAGFITAEQAVYAQKEPIRLVGKKKRTVQASYFLDYIANELVGRYGANQVYKGGLKVYTTLDIKQQQAAEAVLGKFQGAVLVLDPRTGEIKALVGGRNYEESQVNRVIAEVRQPGSIFKPFVYTTALNQGCTASSIIVDERININGYSPQNYDQKYRGPVTLKKALRWSINVAAVKLGQQVGMANVLDLAKSMGITTIVSEDNNLAAALGGLNKGANLMELCSAYTAFANAGVVSKPVAIIKVVDGNGQILEEMRFQQRAVVRPDVAYIITDMLKGVLQDGTGAAANIGRPAAGKTGTTDNYETAWFIGYTPELLAGIYVGNDDRTSVGISGSQVAGMWGTLMTKILAGSKPVDFMVPSQVATQIPICADSGKLAFPGCPETEYSAFVRGTEPTALDPRIKSGQQNPYGSSNQQNQPMEPSPAPKPGWKLPWLRLPGI